MVTVRESEYNELVAFSEMESQPHVRQFINAMSLVMHQKNFSDNNVVYLTIDKVGVGLIGYFILGIEEGRDSVEFRRVVISENYRGVGQMAIKEMESYCKLIAGARRIWLDVYADNSKGMHIYEKLGYSRFKVESVGSRVLYFYGKQL